MNIFNNLLSLYENAGRLDDNLESIYISKELADLVKTATSESLLYSFPSEGSEVKVNKYNLSVLFLALSEVLYTNEKDQSRINGLLNFLKKEARRKETHEEGSITESLLEESSNSEKE